MQIVGNWIALLDGEEIARRENDSTTTLIISFRTHRPLSNVAILGTKLALLMVKDLISLLKCVLCAFRRRWMWLSRLFATILCLQKLEIAWPIIHLISSFLSRIRKRLINSSFVAHNTTGENAIYYKINLMMPQVGNANFQCLSIQCEMHKIN